MVFLKILEALPIIQIVIRWVLERKLEVTVLGIPEPRFYSYGVEASANPLLPAFSSSPLSPIPPRTIVAIADFHVRIINNRHDRPIRISKVEVKYQRRKRFHWSKPLPFFSLRGKGTQVFCPANSENEIKSIELEPVSEKVVRVLLEQDGIAFPGKNERLLVKMDFIRDVRTLTRYLVSFKRFY